jgi:hypothetical protein
LASGLSFGMQHRFVGGPPLELPPPVPDPRAGGIGLAIGAAAGILIGAGILLLRRQSVRHPLARGAATACIGVTVLTMPLWLTPLLGISGP